MLKCVIFAQKQLWCFDVYFIILAIKSTNAISSLPFIGLNFYTYPPASGPIRVGSVTFVVFNQWKLARHFTVKSTETFYNWCIIVQSNCSIYPSVTQQSKWKDKCKVWWPSLGLLFWRRRFRYYFHCITKKLNPQLLSELHLSKSGATTFARFVKKQKYWERKLWRAEKSWIYSQSKGWRRTTEIKNKRRAPSTQNAVSFSKIVILSFMSYIRH